MSRMGNCNYDELKKFAKGIEKMAKPEQTSQFYEDCLKELAARFYRKVKKLTPVGETTSHLEDMTDDDGNVITYKRDGKYGKKGDVKKKSVTDHKGGELRRNWAVSEVIKTGGVYKVIVSNNTEYAAYVNYGHRQTPGRYVPAIGKKLKASWVDGKFMLEISEQELKRIMPMYMSRKLDEYVRRCLNDS